jgi:hypothetical protein
MSGVCNMNKRDIYQSNKPVVALDIDGTLGDYHAHFIRFAQAWTGVDLPSPADINPALPLHKFLGLSKSVYRECKLAYRQGGQKRSMPVYPYASELTKHIRKRRAEVWICTTRPYLRLDNIDPDTRHWLARNNIQYDGVLYGDNKYRDLVRIIPKERILFVVDDLPEMIQQAKDLGLMTILRGQPYNNHVTGWVVGDLKAVIMHFDQEMDKWKK